jgi:hypothetical protein
MATHTDEELALLGVLATGLESRQQQTNGLHIGDSAGRETHRQLLDLQGRVRVDGESSEPDPRRTHPRTRVALAALVLLAHVCGTVVAALLLV